MPWYFFVIAGVIGLFSGIGGIIYGIKLILDAQWPLKHIAAASGLLTFCYALACYIYYS